MCYRELTTALSLTRNSMMNMKKAFSLIEILIVLAILGLLASLILPVVRGNRDKAAYEVSVLNLFEVAKAMDKHYLEKGKYPIFSSWEEVSAEDSPLREYLNDIPKTDGFGKPYSIAKSDESSFEFGGFGVKGKENTYKDYKGIPGPKIVYK